MKKRRISPQHYKEEMYDTKRAVLSYEQLPLEEYDKNADDKNSGKAVAIGKKLFLAALVLVLLVAAVFAVFNRFSCTGCATFTHSTDNFPLTFYGTLISNGNFDTYSSGFAYVSDTHYVVCDSNGEEIFSSQVSFNQPIMHLNYNATSIIYDVGGYKYSVYSENSEYLSSETTEKLYLADVTPDLKFATVTETRDYKAKLSVYANADTPLFGYSFEEYYITALALNSDGSGAAVCGVTAENGIEKSVVYIFDFTEEKPVAFHELSGEVAFDCEYLNDGSVCVIGESSSYIINGKSFSKLNKSSYSQMTLVSYDINTDTSELCLSLSRSGDGRNCTVLCIDDGGSVSSQIETECSAKFTSSYKNRVAVSDKNKIYLYAQDGELLSTVNAVGDSRQVRLFAADACFVLGLKDISMCIF